MRPPRPPATGAEWVSLGEHHLAAHRVAEAAACYERAVQLEPGVWTYWARLGKLHMATRQFDAAEFELSRASMLQPNLAELHTLTAYVLREQNQADAAIAACHRALAVDPDDMHAAIAEALMIPPICMDAADLHRWRARVDAGIERLRQRISSWRRAPLPILDLEWTNFLLAYQGENDLGLQKRYSQLVATLLGIAVPELQAPSLRRRAPGAKIAVGFVSSDFRECTVGDYFARWITDLPRDRFHVTTFYTGHTVDDRTREIQQGSDHFAQVTGRADEIAKVVRERNLDISVLPDVGMSAKSVLLANLRLARIQCAGWGHPVTTGSAFVDYFISCAAMEPRDAQLHYSEALLPLPGIGVRYQAPNGGEGRTRAQFGLPAVKHIYVCPQSLCKIHPDNDALFIELVERDPLALLVFFEGQALGQTRAFARRLEQCLRRFNVPPRQQIKLLPRMSREDFLSVLKLSDVMIDTLHWSGGNTTLDALASALPVITLKGGFMRGRQSAAMLRILGLDELIARDRDHYIDLALRVAADEPYRVALSDRIRRGLPELFDRTEPIAALADTLERVAKAD